MEALQALPNETLNHQQKKRPEKVEGAVPRIPNVWSFRISYTKETVRGLLGWKKSAGPADNIPELLAFPNAPNNPIIGARKSPHKPPKAIPSIGNENENASTSPESQQPAQREGYDELVAAQIVTGSSTTTPQSSAIKRIPNDSAGLSAQTSSGLSVKESPNESKASLSKHSKQTEQSNCEKTQNHHIPPKPAYKTIIGDPQAGPSSLSKWRKISALFDLDGSNKIYVSTELQPGEQWKSAYEKTWEKTLQDAVRELSLGYHAITSISLRLAGPDEEVASFKPTILVICRPSARHDVELKVSKLVKFFQPTVEHKVIGREIKFIGRQRNFASRTTPSSHHLQPSSPLGIWTTPPKSSEIQENTLVGRSGISGNEHFTIGGVISVGSRLYALSTAHAFCNGFFARPHRHDNSVELGPCIGHLECYHFPSKLDVHDVRDFETEIPKLEGEDWALIQLRPEYCLPNIIAIYKEPDQSSRLLYIAGFKKNAEFSTEDVLVCANRGPQSGTLNTMDESIVFDQVTFKVRCLTLLEPLVDGDSGSWVVQDGKVCGTIFSRIEGLPWAYMLPIKSTLQSISATLGVEDVDIPDIDTLRILSLLPENSYKSFPRLINESIISSGAQSQTLVAGRIQKVLSDSVNPEPAAAATSETEDFKPNLNALDISFVRDDYETSTVATRPRSPLKYSTTPNPILNADAAATPNAIVSQTENPAQEFMLQERSRHLVPTANGAESESVASSEPPRQRDDRISWWRVGLLSRSSRTVPFISSSDLTARYNSNSAHTPLYDIDRENNNTNTFEMSSLRPIEPQESLPASPKPTHLDVTIMKIQFLWYKFGHGRPIFLVLAYPLIWLVVIVANGVLLDAFRWSIPVYSRGLWILGIQGLVFIPPILLFWKFWPRGKEREKTIREQLRRMRLEARHP